MSGTGLGWGLGRGATGVVLGKRGAKLALSMGQPVAGTRRTRGRGPDYCKDAEWKLRHSLQDLPALRSPEAWLPERT